MGPRKYFRTFSVIRSKEIRRKQRNPISRTKEDEGLEYLLEHNTHCKDQEFRHTWYSFQSMTSLNEQPEQAFLKTENISEPAFSCSRILRYRCFARKPISVLLFAPFLIAVIRRARLLGFPEGKRAKRALSPNSISVAFFSTLKHIFRNGGSNCISPRKRQIEKREKKRNLTPVGR